MVNFTPNRLDAIQKGFIGKRIAVVGDLMLDKYYWAQCPAFHRKHLFPVVEVDEESTRLGGAANVANNIASLGGVPLMICVVGMDNGADMLRTLVAGNGFPVDGIVADGTRPTTIKTRVIAHGQHVVRIDQEKKVDINAIRKWEFLPV